MPIQGDKPPHAHCRGADARLASPGDGDQRMVRAPPSPRNKPRCRNCWAHATSNTARPSTHNLHRAQYRFRSQAMPPPPGSTRLGGGPRGPPKPSPHPHTQPAHTSAARCCAAQVDVTAPAARCPRSAAAKLDAQRASIADLHLDGACAAAHVDIADGGALGAAAASKCFSTPPYGRRPATASATLPLSSPLSRPLP